MAISRRAIASPSAETPDEAKLNAPSYPGDGKRKTLSSRKVPLTFLGLVVICPLFWISAFGNDSENSFFSSSPAHLKIVTKEHAKKEFMNCTIKFTPPPPRMEQEWRKPLWIPSYPASGSAGPSHQGDLLKGLIDGFTGLKRGTKNFHMSMGRKLKRCKGLSETVACSQGHPMVPVGVQTQTENFQSSVVFPLRNIATAFPAFVTDKGIAYHEGQGQTPQNEWRKQRDQFLQGAIDAWLDMLDWWRKSKDYKIALYVPYEELLEPQTGPPLVQRLAGVFKDAGFEVAPKEDIPCIWFDVAHKEWKRQKQLVEYIPGYTESQKKLLEKELVKYRKSLKKNEDQLAKILDSYIVAIRDEIRVDQPWDNKTAAS